MYISYQPELSFYGTLHWEMEGGAPAVHGLSATYIERAPTALDNGWIYASVGDTYSGLKSVGLDSEMVSGRLVGLKLWFACYYCESASSYRYRYRVTVYDDRQPNKPFQFYTLDVSRNGYLAVYKSSKSAAETVTEPLWELQGLDPWDVADGGSFSNLTLISPTGNPVRRQMEDYFPYLNDQRGHDARFTLSAAQDAKRRPW